MKTAVMRSIVIRGGLLLTMSVVSRGASICDLNQDGTVNVVDVQLMTNMVIGTASCNSSVIGAGVCSQAARTVVLNAALGGGCHSVTLNWTASSSAGVTGYNVYRSTTSGSGFTKVTSSAVSGTNFTDTTVAPGVTYYYVATAVDGSGNESGFSSQIMAAVPGSPS